MGRIEQLQKRLQLLNTIMCSYNSTPLAAGVSSNDILENVSLMLDWKNELEQELQNLTTNFNLGSLSAGAHGQAR